MASLLLPDVRRTRSDRIGHVKVHLARSPSFKRVYLTIFEENGLTDFNRVVAVDASEPKLQPLSQGRFELLQLP